MSDDRQEPPADDATRPLPPAADDGTRPLPPPGDRPAGQPLDATAPHEPVDATARHEPVDATRPLPPPADDATRRQPAAVPAATVWSGRAGVPPPRPADYQEPVEWYAEDQRDRRWWTPILLAILALLLLGLLGAGIWLALRAVEEPGSDPAPPPVPSSAPVTTAAPTTTAPTTEPPTSPPTTTAVDRVPVPPLTGVPRASAEAIMDRLGLSYRVRTRPSDDQRPGTVIETDPEAGELVRTDEVVTLFVAAAPPPTPSRTEEPEPTPEETPTR
ncbi:PASTA domain-containing protein [Micromonospora sp. CPCC 205556]|uniref:PASTA domain-containing protein n=1 Tax=Micromonospora sp. CPCC 205556 TaxID=3122398 RepID=UPI002FF38CC4